MYYIQETDKPYGMLYNLLKMFDILRINEDKIILPIMEENIGIKKARKLAKRTADILKKVNCNTIVLSKKINKQEDYINFLYSNDIKIVDGKWLFKALTLEVLDYIVEKKRMKKENIYVSILINDLEMNMIEIIKEIIKQYKGVNIVTNHFEKFRKIEQQILEEEGIMVTVTNNKRKSLYKSHFILNVDFPDEMINKFKIYDEAIIINLRGNVHIQSKRFNGLNILDYEISFDNGEEFDKDKRTLYDQKLIYESIIYKNRRLRDLKRKFIEDKVKIKFLKCNKSIL